MKWSLRILVLVGLIVVGRELHVRQTEVTAVAGVVEEQRDALGQAESAIEDLEIAIGAADDQIRLLDERITAIERRHPRGIPGSELDGYRRLVAERNALARRKNDLAAEQHARIDDYGRLVTSHNANVAEATQLARGGTPAAVVRALWSRLLGRTKTVGSGAR